MKIKELLKNLKVEKVVGNTALEIKGISDDSRRVKPGYLFVALKGERYDGHNFISEAISKGITALVVEKEINFPFPLWIKVENSRKFLSFLAHRFYGEPTQRLKIIGITGTNGKTTTSNIISHLLSMRGEKVGRIGTIHYRWGDRVLPASLTTPTPLTLFELLSSMKNEGICSVVMEISSHSLTLGRVEAALFDSAIFTNLTHDHLDFHSSMEEYFRAKLRLLHLLKKSKKTHRVAIFNLDDPYFSRISYEEGITFKSFGKKKESNIRVVRFLSEWEGIHFTVLEDGERKENLFLPLAGEFNLYNALASITWARAEGMGWEEIRKGLQSVEKVPGRFEVIERNGIRVVVDYAHTPDALENVLRSARKLTPGKLITLFGCGGERDRDKRPLMGKISSFLSDIIIITSDNPRGEDPLQIIREIENGIENKKYYTIPDREEAIYKAISIAEPGDTIIVAGKGHENYQIWKDVIIPFSDQDIVRKALKSRFLGKVKV
ncbi:UDP-N-acetylmuramoyl-L-alanyl-D-glutamate--2,6-diaminopimelate ligase [Candidatus Calescamantes bacterium]|nr:UDP-N-acetylmuramoyl-L-alanyl-D-glutamate--2,6-diaminopimelate ligase [Candidatus Calescamantes bacterium]